MIIFYKTLTSFIMANALPCTRFTVLFAGAVLLFAWLLCPRCKLLVIWFELLFGIPILLLLLEPECSTTGRSPFSGRGCSWLFRSIFSSGRFLWKSSFLFSIYVFVIILFAISILWNGVLVSGLNIWLSLTAGLFKVYFNFGHISFLYEFELTLILSPNLLRFFLL